MGIELWKVLRPHSREKTGRQAFIVKNWGKRSDIVSSPSSALKPSFPRSAGRRGWEGILRADCRPSARSTVSLLGTCLRHPGGARMLPPTCSRHHRTTRCAKEQMTRLTGIWHLGLVRGCAQTPRQGREAVPGQVPCEHGTIGFRWLEKRAGDSASICVLS